MEQTRDNVLRYGEVVGCELLNFFVIPQSMKTPSREECLKENCASADQQFSRILRRWHAEPLGLFNDDESNHQTLRVATEFLIGRILALASDSALREYWCDGTDFVHGSSDRFSHLLGGACIASDRHADAQWLAPFELSLEYTANDQDVPAAVCLRLGHRDNSHAISRRYPTGRTYRLYAMAHALYGARPTIDDDWAAIVSLNPYPRR